MSASSFRNFLLGISIATLFASASRLSAQSHAASVTIEKPKARSAATGSCRILSDGTMSGTWGRSDLPMLAFSIGPKATMAKEMHASLAPFTGPGRYPNEIVAVYLGATALVDSYAGLGTVTINADGHSGSFVLNDGKASGHFDCGAAPTK
jgi:hypothetical protein